MSSSIVNQLQSYVSTNIAKPRKMNIDDYNRMLASACAGVCATMAGHPFDTLKVRFQATALTNTKNASIISTIITMIKSEGLMPFYRGVIPPTAVKSLTTCVFFTTNGYLKECIIARKRIAYANDCSDNKNGYENDDPILSLTETCLVAAFCGFILAPFISIGEFVKIQLQMDRVLYQNPNTHSSSKYTNMVDCSQQIFERRLLHRGMFATSLRLIPGWGVYLLVYDAWNRYFDGRAVLGNNNPLDSMGTTARVLLGASLAGWASWITSYPFDYIKTQIHAQSIDNNNPLRIRDVCRYTMKNSGLKGFYRGLVPCLMRSFPVNVCNLWIYESVLQILEERK